MKFSTQFTILFTGCTLQFGCAFQTQASRRGISPLKASRDNQLEVLRKNSAVLATAALLIGSNPAVAYETSDYASETVKDAIEQLKSSSGNSEATFKAFENINEIITEGKGVGGSINYKGVQLDRGYIADEDTSIYNPGLTLLTESEKERLVEAILQSRKAGVQVGQWNEEEQLGFEFLRMKLDPFHMNELRGFLQIFPFYVGAVYLGVLAVQQIARDIFPVAYFIGVGAVFLPILALILTGA
jgi:hypothetical protein